MKRLLFSLAVSTLLSFVALAQTPKPATRPPATSPSSPTTVPAGGEGAEGKIALINFAQLQEGINELKVKIDALNTEFEPKRKEIQALEEELNNLNNQIQTKGATVNQQVRQQWVDALSEKERLYKRKGEDYEQLGQKRLAEVSQPTYDKIYKFLGSYCEQHGIVLVVEIGAAYQANLLFYASVATDITDDFMKEYNKANPAGSGAKSS